MMNKDKFPLALSMIQPSPLPGSYRNRGEKIASILNSALKEAEMIAENGFDGFILQNMNDMPIKQRSNMETVAYMTRIGTELRRNFPELVMGVLINWDGVASLAVADAIEADFIRIEHLYTGAEVTSAGILEGQCCDICDLRRKLGSNVPVYADIFEVHGTHIAPKSIENMAWEIVNEAFADGIFLSGRTPKESIELSTRARTKLKPDVPIFLGGGATGDNIAELIPYFDGVSVATWIKNGDMKNPIDKDRARIFIERMKNRK